MNFDECLDEIIKLSVLDVLEQMKSLSEDDRQALMFEHIENLAGWESEEVLMVPNFQENEIDQ